MSRAVDHVLALLVGLVLPAVAALSVRYRKEHLFDEAGKIRLYWTSLANLWVVAGLVAGVWIWQGRGLERLGLALPDWNATAGLVAAVFALLVAFDTWLQIRNRDALERTRERWRRDTPFMPATRREFAHYVAPAISASVCEEVLFRGYLIRYLQSRLEGAAFATALSIALPALVFGVAHLYQGLWGAAKVVLLAVAFGWIFVLTSSLFVPMSLHALVDLAMGALGLWIARPPSVNVDDSRA